MYCNWTYWYKRTLYLVHKKRKFTTQCSWDHTSGHRHSIQRCRPPPCSALGCSLDWGWAVGRREPCGSTTWENWKSTILIFSLVAAFASSSSVPSSLAVFTRWPAPSRWPGRGMWGAPHSSPLTAPLPAALPSPLTGLCSPHSGSWINCKECKRRDRQTKIKNVWSEDSNNEMLHLTWPGFGWMEIFAAREKIPGSSNCFTCSDSDP